MTTTPYRGRPRGVLERYADRLPLTPLTPRITLGEGGTPLVQSNRVARELGLDRLYFKLEGCNPTGSFKDRGMVVAVAKALEQGHRTIICASTGNTSASAAAYGAHCGLDTVVLIPHGRIAHGKLAQAIAHGVRVVSVRGSFDQALHLGPDAGPGAARGPGQLRQSLPHRRTEDRGLRGRRRSGDAPDYLCIPVGNAGNITAYWKGFCEYQEAGLASGRPRMMGFQAAGAAPLVHGTPVEDPQTVASAIRIGNPASWEGAIRARDESGGAIDSVTDEEILEAYRDLARLEGVFCEPASAASLAGLAKLVREGADFRGKSIVCVLTGTGLKDPEAAEGVAAEPVLEVPPDLDVVAQAVLG